MVRLSRSRTSPWREELGYIDGGSQVVLEALGRDLEARGGRVVLNAPVEQIVIAGRPRHRRARGRRDAAGGRRDLHRHHLALPRSSPPDLDGDYVERLARIPTIGIFCLFLRLREPVTPFFWVNTNDPRVPFAGMIEYTNLNPLPELGGDRILYVPQYLSADDPRYAQADEDVLRALHRRARPHPSRLRPELGQVLRRLPRPLRAADLPDRLPRPRRPAHRDAGRQPVPHRLLPAPPARPHDQRLVRPRAGGGPAGAPVTSRAGRDAGVSVETVVAAACLAGGTATLYVALRTLVPAGAAAGSLMCLLLGTSLGAAVMPATDVRAAAGFWGAAAAVAWSAPVGRHPGRFAGGGLLLLCALALTAGADLRDARGLRLGGAFLVPRRAPLLEPGGVGGDRLLARALPPEPWLGQRAFRRRRAGGPRDQRRAGRGRWTVGRAAVRMAAPSSRPGTRS